MGKRVAVVGGGIFGTTTALELSKNNFDVELYESSNKLLSGASTNNHLRHHKGYHYPRSEITALECIRAQESFDKEYRECLVKPFNHYQAIAKDGSKITPKEFLRFCDKLNLPYEVVDIDGEIINKDRTSVILKIPEYSYNPEIMLNIVEKKLEDSEVKVNLKAEVRNARIEKDKKILEVLSYGDYFEAKFDFVVNATYSNFNRFNKWFNLPQKNVLYELVEMVELELPLEEKIGLSMFDGPFGTIMPRVEKGRFTLAHIKESIIQDVVSDNLKPEFVNYKYNHLKTNISGIMRASELDYPIIKKAKVVRPIYITRVVKSNVDDTDERPSEVTNHGNGLFTIFSGKVVTCVDVAKKITENIKKECVD